MSSPVPPVPVYRVSADHPMLAAAKLGIVAAADENSDMTPEEHKLMFMSEASPYTSWSYSLAIARLHAMGEFARSVSRARGSAERS